jgi:catalase
MDSGRILSNWSTIYSCLNDFAMNLKVNEKGEVIYCKFHLKSLQGLHNLTVERAMNLSATDPDYAQRDLYNAIENGVFPKWNLSIQVCCSNNLIR